MTEQLVYTAKEIAQIVYVGSLLPKKKSAIFYDKKFIEIEELKGIIKKVLVMEDKLRKELLEMIDK